MSAAISSSVSTSNSSLWKLPGLDKDTFYAAALLLSVTKGNINAGRYYREPKTPQDTRDFLDHLADCFARSKLQDRSDHVSATAMVKDEKQKMITLYIAKNRSEKKYGSLGSPEERVEVQNENDVFAKSLIEWFNHSDDEDATQPNQDDLHSHSTIFKTMCDFNESRLEHYIEKICEADVETLDATVTLYLRNDLDDRSLQGLENAKKVITMCQGYKISTSDSESLSEEVSSLTCAKLAGRARGDGDFQKFASVVETLPESKRSKLEDLTYVVGGIKYLGRLFPHTNTSNCTWEGDTYLGKIDSWAEVLNLSERQKSIDSGAYSDARKKMRDIVEKSDNKGSVHCEMQLLMHFLGQNAEKCEDYFGYSKKSCWLCWQMMSKNSRHIMKDTHRKIYPAWVFPFDYSASQPAIADGLITAYNIMLPLVQGILIKGTHFTFLEPLVQSSLRMSPAYRPGPLNSSADGSTKSEEFPEPVITVRDKLHANSVKAVHLPEYGSSTTSRIVEVRAYEAPQFEVGHPSIIHNSFGDKECIFAFQLRTNPGSINLDSGVEEHQRAVWSVAGFSNMALADDADCEWSMFYRTAETLKANPYISSLCAKTQPEFSQPIPWRGDIFIIQHDVSDGRAEFGSESLTLDEGACLEALKRRLEMCSEIWDTEKAAEQDIRIAEFDLEICKDGLRLQEILATKLEKIKEEPQPEDEIERLKQQQNELTLKLEAAHRKWMDRRPGLSAFLEGV